MAASGYKLFVTGDVLTAAQVNDYLMLQTVMVFANSAARTSALSGVLAEGLVSYLKDTDVVEVYTGAAWVSLDDPNAIQNSIVDAKGDLIAASADNTPARLAVGNNGESLVADSSATTGLRYQSAYNGNAIINGGFDIWQRGTANVTTASSYTADRWQKGAATSFGISRQVTGDTTNLPNIQYCARSQRTASSAVTTANDFGYSMETNDAVRFAGQPVILSFYARAGANFSSASSILNASIYTGTGTDQNGMTTGYTGNTLLVTGAKTLTTTWQRFTISGTVASTATELMLYFSYTPVGTAGANDYYEITGVQLELGSVATTFKRSNGSGGTIQGELAACQRYYFRSGASGGVVTSAYNLHAQGYEESATIANYCFKLPVTMRVAPTAIEYANVDIYDSTNRSLSALTINSSYNNPNSPELVATGTGMAQYRPCFLLNWNNTGGYVALTAEL